ASGKYFASFVLDGNFNVGYRFADGAGLPWAANGIDGNDGAGFAKAITFDERNRKSLIEFAQNFVWQRRGAADAEAEGKLDRDRRVGQGAKKLRDGGKNSGVASDDFGDDILRRVQGFYDNHRAAHAQRQENANTEHEAVEHRQRHDETV